MISFIKSSALTALTSAQQEQLFQWLEAYPTTRVLELVAAPAPDGFGLVTHYTTLRRFHARARAVFQQQLARDASETAPNGILEPPSEQETLQTLRQSALELATLNPNSSTHFSAVSLGLVRLKQAEQRERQLDLATKRLQLQSNEFQFKAARSALDHLDELCSIADAEGDETSKLIAARKAMFSELPL